MRIERPSAGSSGFTVMDPLQFSLFIMAAIILLYTVLGGIKAVIYTDTIQWIILLSGLLFAGIPIIWFKLGGWETISASLPANHFSLLNIKPITFINWFFTIVPIWFIAMTLYQRAFACRSAASNFRCHCSSRTRVSSRCLAARAA